MDIGPFANEEGELVYRLENVVYENNEEVFVFKEPLIGEDAITDFKMQFLGSGESVAFDRRLKIESECQKFVSLQATSLDLLSFFHDRLKVMLRDQGARHDLVDAVLANGETNDDLLLVVRRVEALGKFLDTEDGKSLLAGAKRAINFLAQAEKKDGEGAFEQAADAALLVEASEKALHIALSKAGEAALHAIEKQDYAAAMRAMASLRAPVDDFANNVIVNADDPAIRRNRLALLATLRRVTRQVADFSKIAG